MPAALENSLILALTDDFWDGHRRVRHRMPQAWAEAGNHVLWLEQNPFADQIATGRARLGPALSGNLREVQPRLHVGTMPPAFPGMLKGGGLGNALRSLHRPLDVRRIRRYLREVGWEPDVVVLFQQPVRHDLLALFPKALKIYYCSDLYGFGNATAGEVGEEAACAREVDVVFATSEALCQRLEPHNAHTYHIPHGVDVSWWESNRETVPQEYAQIPAPRCVFTGVVFDRLDFDLLQRVAALRRDWQFLLVGPITGAKEAVDKLQQEPNMHVLGARQWEEIPGYLAGADVLMMPFLGRPTAANSGLPLKFYEYAISGKPILSSNFTKLELPHPDMAEVAEDAEGWSRFLANVASDPERQSALASMRQEIAAANTYQARLARQREILATIGSGA